MAFDRKIPSPSSHSEDINDNVKEGNKSQRLPFPHKRGTEISGVSKKVSSLARRPPATTTWEPHYHLFLLWTEM
jgi:hypothetical protein